MSSARGWKEGNRTRVRESTMRSLDPHADLGCICGYGLECKGITGAFTLLKYHRQGYVQLPNLVIDPLTQAQRDQNKLRAAYLRHLCKNTELPDGNDLTTRYVALHHFHPTVVETHVNRKNSMLPIPITLKPIDVRYLHLDEFLTEEDRVRDDNGQILDLYYFVPCYPLSKTKVDLKRLIRMKRIKGDTSKKKRAQETPTLEESQTVSRENDELHQALESAESLLESAESRSESAESLSESTKSLPKSEKSPPESTKSLSESPDIIPPTDSGALPVGVNVASSERPKSIHSKLLLFESSRRANCSAKHDDYVWRWKSALLTMQGGIFECARTERLLLGTVIANQAYGEAMQLMYDDVFLDNEGNIVTSASGQSKLKKNRSQEEYAIDFAAPLTQGQTDATENRSTLLDNLIASQCNMAKCFSDHGDAVKSKVVPELTALRRELENKLLEFRGRGELILREMTDAENEVRETWSAYDSHSELLCEKEKSSPIVSQKDALGIINSSEHGVAFANDGDEDPPPLPQGPNVGLSTVNESSISQAVPVTSEQGQSPRSSLFRRGSNMTFRSVTPERGRFFRDTSDRSGLVTSISDRGLQINETEGTAMENSAYRLRSPAAAVIKSIASNKDMWMREMLYRSAVNFASQLWERGAAEMENIFETMQQLEAQRRMRIQQEILYFLPGERRQFLGLSDIMRSIFEDLLGNMVNSEFNNDFIEESIRKRSELISRIESRKHSKIMNRSRTCVPDLDEILQPLPGELFDNGLLKHAKVVERKSGLLGHWRTNLAVITADSVLHLFESTLIANLERGTIAEATFQELLPTYEMPTMATMVPTRRDQALLTHLVPAVSINLCNCSALQDISDPQVMDIQEVVTGRFIRESIRKFTIRTTGREETQRLVEVILDCSASRLEKVQKDELIATAKEDVQDILSEQKDENYGETSVDLTVGLIPSNSRHGKVCEPPAGMTEHSNDIQGWATKKWILSGTNEGTGNFGLHDDIQGVLSHVDEIPTEPRKEEHEAVMRVKKLEKVSNGKVCTSKDLKIRDDCTRQADTGERTAEVTEI